MFFDGVVRIMGRIDVSEMKSLITEVPEDAWLSDWRRNANPNFYDSHSLWMVSMPFTSDGIFHAFNSTITCQHENFQKSYMKFQRELETMLDGTVVRSCIIRLTPGNSVKRHIDGRHPVFRWCYRIIIPILTNEQSTLFYDDKDFVLEEGIVYDTNPFLPHGTRNLGTTNRYQVVLDVLPRDTPDCKIVLKKYDEWDPELCRSLEPKDKNRDRNLELDSWTRRYNTEMKKAMNHKDLFKYSDFK
jgi:hypothetical protein